MTMQHGQSKLRRECDHALSMIHGQTFIRPFNTFKLRVEMR